VIPVRSINPGHAEGLEEDDEDEGKCGRIVIKHSHKIVSTALSEHETDQKAHRTAACWERREKDKTMIRPTHKTERQSKPKLYKKTTVLPVKRNLWLRRVLKVSVSGVSIPAMVPNMVDKPRLSSMRKNSTDQNGLPGNNVMASVNAMNARPVPSTP